jgi:hypothetical protein
MRRSSSVFRLLSCLKFFDKPQSVCSSFPSFQVPRWASVLFLTDLSVDLRDYSVDSLLCDGGNGVGRDSGGWFGAYLRAGDNWFAGKESGN